MAPARPVPPIKPPAAMMQREMGKPGVRPPFDPIPSAQRETWQRHIVGAAPVLSKIKWRKSHHKSTN